MTSLRRPRGPRFSVLVAAGAAFVAAGAGCGARPIQSGLAGAPGRVGGAGGSTGQAGSTGSAGTSAEVDGGGGASSDPPRALGQSCAISTDCASGFCVDGVCCNVACTAGCLTCAAPGSVGTCTNRPAASIPRNAADCVATAAASCGLDGTCDGAGSCRLWVTGTVCAGGSCNGQNVMGQRMCNGAGACLAGPNVINCAPYTCDSTAGACRDHCTTDNDCSGGRSCLAGSCLKSNSAGACTQSADCASGYCVDGVCCNVACAGPCVSCNLTGKVGTCWPVATGAPDPRGVCVDQGPASCGQTSTCDGVGGCAHYPAGTLCAPAACSDGAFTPARICDGSGTCGAAAAPMSCPSGCTPNGTACNITN